MRPGAANNSELQRAQALLLSGLVSVFITYDAPCGPQESEHGRNSTPRSLRRAPYRPLTAGNPTRWKHSRGCVGSCRLLPDVATFIDGCNALPASRFRVRKKLAGMMPDLVLQKCHSDRNSEIAALSSEGAGTNVRSSRGPP